MTAAAAKFSSTIESFSRTALLSSPPSLSGIVAPRSSGGGTRRRATITLRLSTSLRRRRSSSLEANWAIQMPSPLGTRVG